MPIRTPEMGARELEDYMLSLVRQNLFNLSPMAIDHWSHFLPKTIVYRDIRTGAGK
jgi:hypothetical protein